MSSLDSTISVGTVGSTAVGPVRTRFRVRRACLTLNNPTDEDFLCWTRLLLLGNMSGDSPSKLTFLVVQTERGLSGTLHYQAYCEMSAAVGLRNLKAIFGQRVSVLAAHGSASQNIVYCTKLDSRDTGDARCVAGTWGRAKKAGNTVMAVSAVMTGENMVSLLEKFPVEVMKFGSKLEVLMCRRKGRRDKVPIVTILTGLTGCGKSKYAQTVWPDAYWVCPPASGGRVWWGGYVCESVCVFDDFTSGWFKLTTLLRFIDSHPLKVAPKGSQVEFNSDHLVFTCNVDPCDWYSGYAGNPLHKDALERRIQEFATIVDCTKRDDGSFVREIRHGDFHFRDANLLPAGNGDMEGNGFMYNMDNLF